MAISIFPTITTDKPTAFPGPLSVVIHSARYLFARRERTAFIAAVHHAFKTEHQGIRVFKSSSSPRKKIWRQSAGFDFDDLRAYAKTKIWRNVVFDTYPRDWASIVASVPTASCWAFNGSDRTGETASLCVFVFCFPSITYTYADLILLLSLVLHVGI
jgi:hypothetical protein